MIKSKIEWCDSSWSPITGCNNNCEYCYARKIANRYKGCLDFPEGNAPGPLAMLTDRMQAKTKSGDIRYAAYPFGFTPTFHYYRLNDPQTKGFGKNIFVCSMADMFGDWIPDIWIEKIFEACLKADNHRYLFLTKNPKRYLDLAEKGKLPEKDIFWYGSTATTPDAEVFFSDKHNTFVSIEPILAPFDKNGMDLVEKVDWAIFGAETGNRKDKVIPERSWIEYAVDLFHQKGKAVFMKDSLKEIWGENLITEFPWSE